MGEEGREGDWECSGCRNRNYAFRTFCNRCKQPRLLVDTHTPADSKWIPRIGDWICTACTNNNYASREKCKKCGQAKEVSAMHAISLPESSLPNYSHYFVKAHGVPEQKMNFGQLSNGSLLQSFPPGLEWPVGGVHGYGISSAWPLSGNFSSESPYANNANQLVPKDWRNGDWVCNCGFHNYASRSQCKKCSAYMPAALGIKRSASEELAHDLDNKRLNAGETNENHNPGFIEPKGLYAPFVNGTSAGASNLQVNMSALLGKGAMHWRDGDWMCSNCNNHNYASRGQCNRCKAQRDAVAMPMGV